ASALAPRPARHERSRGNLFAALTPLVDVCGGAAKIVCRSATVSWHRRYKDAICHRRCGFGRRRKINDSSRAAGAAGALAERSEGRSHYDGWISLSECHTGTGRPHGKERLSRKLRSSGIAAVPVRREGRAPPGTRAHLFAPRLR